MRDDMQPGRPGLSQLARPLNKPAIEALRRRRAAAAKGEGPRTIPAGMTAGPMKPQSSSAAMAADTGMKRRGPPDSGSRMRDGDVVRGDLLPEQARMGAADRASGSPFKPKRTRY